ncbi:MAG: hypothetical protein JWQ23_1239 [Herminiimonas sp.]|nr:hypothetical protein [Herminiimonas sp.]
MKRWRKTAWWSAGILALVLALAPIALRALFDEAHLKSLVRDKARAALSRELEIGDLSVELMPLPAIHARNLTLSNPAWARSRHLLEAASLSARIDLLPLLSGRIAITSVTLTGLQANLEVAADGRRSWDLQTAQPDPDGRRKADLLALTEINVRNAAVSYLKHDAEPAIWRIDQFTARGQPGWRDVRIETRISRNAAHQMQATARFADLSRAGASGAASQGEVRLEWKQARLDLSGRLPLAGDSRSHAFKLAFEADSPADVLGFLNLPSGPVAPIRASADFSAEQDWTHARNLKASLGKLTVAGDVKFSVAGTRPVFDATLSTDRLDWAEALRDAGRPAPPPLPPDEILRTHALGWPALIAMKGMDGTVDAQIASLRLRSGVEVSDARARMAFKGDQLNVNAFSFHVFGGTASGDMRLDGRRQAVRLNLQARDISLERWFAEKNRKAPFSGARMAVSAAVSASGTSMKQLGATLTGPVTIRVGNTKIFSEKVEQAETLLTGVIPFFSAKEANHVELACVTAVLPFSAGVATASPIAGARSEASQLLTRGVVDLRRQTLDLRGRIKARNGVTLGVATLAGDVRIGGRLRRPEMSLDPDETPSALVRLGAAIATGGISIVAGALWDSATRNPDPCEAVFRPKKDAAGVKADVKKAAAH